MNVPLKYPTAVNEAVDALEASGFEIYIVGGCLRNVLMGKAPHDWDMTTSALPQETAEIFRTLGHRVIETGLKHGTVTVIIDGTPLEITTFRIDGSYSDSRHPDKVSFTRSLREDLIRRDFTVNAMAYSEKKGLIGLFDGKSDLKAGILRAVGDPEKRFSEDALRILRAFRFSSEHGFVLEERTKEAVIKLRAGLVNISRERICSELYRILLGENASFALKEILACGIMPYIFEEYDNSFELDISFINALPKNIAPRLGAILLNFPQDKAEKALSSLKTGNEDKSNSKAVLQAVGELKCSPPQSIAEARRFVRRFGKNLQDALSLAKFVLSDIAFTEELILQAQEEDFPKKPAELAIGGNDIIALGASGKKTGEVLSFLLERTTDDPTLNCKEELLRLAKEFITEN